MRFVHADPTTVAEVTSFTDKTGWEHLLVVIKASYSIPENGGTPQAIAAQALAMKDEFAGEPGLSAPLYENDFASRKACCDVLFRAQAHAPGGKPVKTLDVAAQVGSMMKAIHVVGDRRWEKDLLFVRHSEPEPFTTMPLHYGRAFGGCVSYTSGGDSLSEAYMPNPVGTGYSQRKEHASLHGMLLPNLEVPGRPLQRPDTQYPALALSAVARNFYPRYSYAGSYDQHWRDEIAPFLPEDFDERFFQCAPEDQQIPFPHGGEQVRLINMMPDRAEVHFRLPQLEGVRVRVLDRQLKVTELDAKPDTLFFEPDHARLSVTWRSSMRLGHKGLHELRTVVAGPICPEWWAAISRGEVGCAGCETVDSLHLTLKNCPDKKFKIVSPTQ